MIVISPPASASFIRKDKEVKKADMAAVLKQKTIKNKAMPSQNCSVRSGNSLRAKWHMTMTKTICSSVMQKVEPIFPARYRRG
ncbi:hypothetical protein D3C77_711860 [compost metagenome]